MGFRYDTSTFFESSGSASAQFGEALRDGVVTFACGIWANFPDYIAQGTNPGSSWARGYMNTVCAPIQPPLPPPDSPFMGGQCCDAQYDVTVQYEFRRCAGDVVVGGNTSTFSVTGQIIGLVLHPCIQSPGLTCLDIEYRDCQGDTFYETVFSTTREIAESDCTGVGGTHPDADKINPGTSTYDITGVVRTDGMPDDCGNPGAGYNSPEPTSDDLRDTFVINVNDGLDLDVDIAFNKNETNYNFPMFFKVNGVNVSLDLGGINFYGNPGGGGSGGGNDSPPPGSDGGEDGAGGSNDKIYDENEYVVAPDFVVPEQVSLLIEYLLCNEGVQELVSETIKVGAGYNPLIVIIIDILKSLVEDVCTTETPTVGLPEYYYLRPGAERPAIVFLWKEYENDAWQNTTFASTVTHPSDAAIENIADLVSFPKKIGKYRQQITLIDGSKIMATGETATEADINFQFLLSRVNPVFLPANVGIATTTGYDERFTIRQVYLRQIEYYPFGKGANITPEIRRLLEFPD
jgi:hypothetical protein